MKYLIEVYMENDKIFEKDANTKKQILDALNCFDFSKDYLRFRVTDEFNKVVPHYYYNKILNGIEY